MFKIDNHDIAPVKTNKKTYLKIVEIILNMVAENKIEYGDKLYSEPELMKMLNVSRPTLREALRVLEFLGIVTIGTRSGITINAPRDTENYSPLIYIMMFEKTTNTDLFELRRAIQVEMAGMATVKRTDEDCENLKAIIKMTEENLDTDYISFSNLDYDFHMAIVKSAKNVLCEKLMETLMVVMRTQLQQIILEMPVELRKNTLKFHKDICDAIITQDYKIAKDIMEKHLDRPYNSLKSDIIKFNLE